MYKIVTNPLVKCTTGKNLNSVKGIVVHWVANPKTSAAANRNYWENQADGVCAHDIIDLDGTVLNCVDYAKECYQVGCPTGYTPRALKELSSYPNNCVVGVECTHIDWTGLMTPETYNTLVEHIAFLCKKFGLTTANVYTHHEIVGDYKDCHRWFTNNPDEWVKFKARVEDILHPAPVVKPAPVQPKPVVKPVVIPPLTGLLKVGVRGDQVKFVQQKLGVAADGIFGPNTQTAVKAFQTKNKIAADGIVGPNTWKLFFQ